MTKKEFIEKIQQLEPAVRAEFDLTQDKMASSIGVSKKTLVEMEKRRIAMGWSEAVALSCVFSSSQILQNAFGGNPTELIPDIALLGIEVRKPERSFLAFWWNEIERNEFFVVQQNIITSHYRLLYGNEKILSSFEYNVIKDQMVELTQKMRKKKNEKV